MTIKADTGEETRAFLSSAAATPLLSGSVAEVIKGDDGLWSKTAKDAGIAPQG